MEDIELLRTARNILLEEMGPDSRIRLDTPLDFEIDNRNGTRIEISISNMRLYILEFESPCDGRERRVYAALSDIAQLLGLAVETCYLSKEVQEMVHIIQLS